MMQIVVLDELTFIAAITNTICYHCWFLRNPSFETAYRKMARLSTSQALSDISYTAVSGLMTNLVALET